jgi:glycosyltransferase involved in cell wall biosynthesis
MVRHRQILWADVWPIDYRAGVHPPGWKGWPGGKQFALVLTHDVETAKGQDNVPALAGLEERLGFRSSFGFVPERYAVSPELLGRLGDRGFEVTVHGLIHDGKYFQSHKIFRERAERINYYLKQWKAVGFRTPSMQHNFDWLHLLDIRYDSSTFDTDPFEPQPEGVRTIFPFFVASSVADRGYVELPYTLAQDFTLFVTMKERTIDIWKRKLDWIAEHGGMALLLTHPDYMTSAPAAASRDSYPIRLYEELLTYVSERYDGRYWHALPRDMAGFWAETAKSTFASGGRSHFVPYAGSSSDGASGKRICMLSYSHYDVDARVSRYAETLARRGDHVDVISLGQKGQEKFARINGVNVYRIQNRKRNEKGKLQFLTRLLRFFVASSIFLSRRQGVEPYDLIHVHSVPDFEVFAAWLPKLKGTPVILDIHDIVPEFYAAKFRRNGRSFLFKALVLIERLSARFADHVIISNHIWQKTLSRSVGKGKCTVVMNFPDSNVFYHRPGTRTDDRFIMAYPGTLNWHQGLDVAVRAFAIVKERIPRAEFHIYGQGDMKESLGKMSEDLGLEGRLFFHDMMPKEQIADVMASADLGVVPKRNDSFGGDAFSTKVLEFMSLGVPVLVAGTRIDRHYFNDSVVRFFEPEDEASLASAMVELAEDDGLRKGLSERARKFVREEYDWETRKGIYLGMVDDFAARCPADRLEGNGRERSRRGMRSRQVMQASPAELKRPRRICMLVYSFYERDNRVLRYAETLVRQGDQVDVIALRREGQPCRGELQGVRVFRIQERIKNEQKQSTYAYRVLKFMLKASIVISRNHATSPYDIVHVHNMPDFLVFSALYAKRTGAKVILDIHDVVPELYATMFARGNKSLLFKLMLLLERASASFADHVIVANHTWQDLVQERSVKNGKSSVVLNYPDQRVFSRQAVRKHDDTFTMVYPGSLTHRQGVDIAVRAFALIKDKLPVAQFHIYGDGAGKEELETLVSELGLTQRVLFKGSVPIRKVAQEMAAADLGIEPKRNDMFSGDAMSTKILEFMAVGVPVVASDTRVHKRYFNDSVLRFFRSGDERDLADAMLEVAQDEAYRKRLIEAGTVFAADFSWERNQSGYLSVLDHLTAGDAHLEVPRARGRGESRRHSGSGRGR